MTFESSSMATIAICCRLPEEPTPSVLEDWMRPVRSANLPVTWVVGPSDLPLMESTLTTVEFPERFALELPAEWLAGEAGQPHLRRGLAAVRRDFPWIDALVVDPRTSPPEGPGVRAELLGEFGFRIVAVPKIGAWHQRRSRRPGPRGWSCRNPAWGIWEVGFTAMRPHGLHGWLPMVIGPRLPEGSLAVLRAGTNSSKSKREARQRFERIVQWASRQTAFGRPPARMMTLSQLGALLATGSAGSGPRSILAA